MTAIVINLVIEQGTDFEATFAISDETGSPLNLTNFNIISTLKKSFYSKTSKSFTATKVNAAAGIIKLSMPSSITSTLKGGRYVYDIVIVSNTEVRKRVIEGIVTVTEGVSL